MPFGEHLYHINQRHHNDYSVDKQPPTAAENKAIHLSVAGLAEQRDILKGDIAQGIVYQMRNYRIEDIPRSAVYPHEQHACEKYVDKALYVIHMNCTENKSVCNADYPHGICTL